MDLFVFGVCLFFLLSVFTVLSVSCSLLVLCWRRDNPFAPLLCDVFLCSGHSPIRCPGPGVVLDPYVYIALIHGW